MAITMDKLISLIEKMDENEKSNLLEFLEGEQDKEFSSPASIEVVDYTEKSIAVIGDTTAFKDELKELGGRWNTKLKNRESEETMKGWIFPKNKKKNLLKVLHIEEDDGDIYPPVASIEVVDYTEKSIAVIGDTTAFKDELKELGGRWNTKLKNRESEETMKGWIFPKSKRDKVEEVIG